MRQRSRLCCCFLDAADFLGGTAFYATFALAGAALALLAAAAFLTAGFFSMTFFGAAAFLGAAFALGCAFGIVILLLDLLVFN